jgi:predicted CoA-binding protein
MDHIIQEFIERKRIAIVGASRNGKKFGNTAAKELRERGYNVFYVHTEAKEIDGQPAYPNLKVVGDLAETLWINIPAEQGIGVLRDAAAVGLTKIWLQQGADSPELLALGEELGLEIIAGKCILMYAEPVRSFHKFHQLIWKWIGQY